MFIQKAVQSVWISIFVGLFMKLSIIIPTLNEAAIIGTQIQSIARKANKKDIEIIVADAYSEDDTANIAR